MSFLEHYRTKIQDILNMPSGRHAVDDVRLEEWIAAQQSETRRRIARILSQHIHYITFNQTKQLCSNLVQEVYESIEPKDKVVWWVGDKTKSSYFISLICYYYLKKYNLPEPTEIVDEMKNITDFKEGHIYLKWDDMTYSGSQIEQLNNNLAKDCMRHNVPFPDIRHCLLAATSHAIPNITKVYLFLGSEMQIARSNERYSKYIIDNMSIRSPFKIHIGRTFQALDELLGPQTFYLCNRFFNNQGASCVVYFDHKVADNVSTYMKMLLYGVVPPKTLKGDMDTFTVRDLKKKYGQFEIPMDEGIDGDIEEIQFKPFLQGCPPMTSLFEQWKDLEYFEFMGVYAEDERNTDKRERGIPNWDDPTIRCPVSWYKTKFRGGFRSRTRMTKRRRRMTRKKLTKRH